MCACPDARPPSSRREAPAVANSGALDRTLTFAAWPKLEGAVGRTFWVDLNGDGRSDAVIARGDALVWFPSVTGPLDEVEREFGEPVVVPLPTGAEAAPGCGPNPQLDLSFADMTGDGMQDLVRVQRGQVEYWPALGNGRFGDRVVMDGAPAVPTTSAFDSARVRLVDLDGSGTADGVPWETRLPSHRPVVRDPIGCHPDPRALDGPSPSSRIPCPDADTRGRRLAELVDWIDGSI